MPGQDDVILVRRLRDRDPEAFREIVSELHGAMLRRARTLVSDHATGEDAVQETWLAVLRGISSFQGRSSLKTWIFSILDNRAKTLAKKASRTTSLTPGMVNALEGYNVKEDLLRCIKPAESFYPLFSSVYPNQESAVIAEETFSHIWDAIGALPHRQRNVFRLRVFGGQSAQSVSAQLEISEGNQRVLLHRARTAVKSAVKDCYGKEPRVELQHRQVSFPLVMNNSSEQNGDENTQL